MSNGNEHFIKYQPMIRKAAWKASKLWGIEYQDMEAQGYLIYTETLERYNSDKSKFSTFLYSRLRTLNDYGKRLNRINNYNQIGYVETPNMAPDSMKDFNSWMENAILWFDSGEPFLSYDDFVEKLEFYDSAASDLSDKAKMILDYILSSSEEKYSFHSVKNYFRVTYKWPTCVIKKLWSEIQEWWNTFLVNGSGLYAN